MRRLRVPGIARAAESEPAPGTRRLLMRVGVAALVVMVGAGVTVAYLVRDPSPVGYWRSAAAQDGYDRHYARAFAALPVPARTLDVPTSFGYARVYEFPGPADRPPAIPIFLLPGRSSGTPMWSRNLPDLAQQRTVYAVDAIGDAGRSVQTRPITSAADQAQWIDDVLSALDLARVHLVGHSFGGWTAANYATRFPGRVASLSLLEPVFVFAGLRWQMYLVSIPASIPFLPPSWRSAMLKNIGGSADIDPGDATAAMIDAGLSGYAAKLPTPEQISAEQLDGLIVPTYVALGGASTMSDADAAATVAAETLRDATVRVWSHASHSLPMEVAEQLDGELLAFMANHDR